MWHQKGASVQNGCNPNCHKGNAHATRPYQISHRRQISIRSVQVGCNSRLSLCTVPKLPQAERHYQSTVFGQAQSISSTMPRAKYGSTIGSSMSMHNSIPAAKLLVVNHHACQQKLICLHRHTLANAHCNTSGPPARCRAPGMTEGDPCPHWAMGLQRLWPAG